jgi:transcriptional regulator with XRE-family HTH domain
VTERRSEEDLNTLWATLRAVRGWKQEDVALAAGLWNSMISDVENGKTNPRADTLAKLASGFGLSISWLDPLSLLVRVLRSVMESSDVPPAEEALAGSHAWAAQAGKALEDFLLPVFALLRADLEGASSIEHRSGSPPSPSASSEGPALWALLEPYTPAQQRAAIQELVEFQNWPLCEFLSFASASMASDCANLAVELADLACRIAEHIPGDEKERSRRKGHAGCYLGNALRVQGNLPEAGEMFDRGLAELKASATAAFPRLDEVRLLNLEASLRREQRRLEEARKLLNQALALDRGGARTGRILVKKAKTLEEMNDVQGALALLLEATPFISSSDDPRLLLVHRFNTLVCLTDLSRHAEAETGLPEVQALTAELGNDLDGVRLRWLEAKIAAGLGRIAEAVRAFFEVRDRFAAEGIAYDTALVTLELAALLAEQGRTAEVKTLAAQTERIFKAQKVERERLGALRLFCGAARKEHLTATLARQLLADLRAGQGVEPSSPRQTSSSSGQ